LCFSSRRRHTRFSRDWSSDVCSSDLRNEISWEIVTHNCALPNRGTPICDNCWSVRRITYSDITERTRIYAGTAKRSPLEEARSRSEEHTSELQSRENLVCRLLLEKKK